MKVTATLVPQGPERRQQYLDLQQENRQLAAVTADLERQLADMNGNLAAMEKVGLVSSSHLT